MGTRTQTTVFDDFDHSTERVGTYRFALEGKTYEIDLSETNRDRLRDALAPFIAAGRRVAAAPAQRHTGAAGRERTRQVRTWWKDNWQRLQLPEPNSVGVIPTRVRDAYDQAH
jgi:hypothetical protein